jgi:hypothetical protein
MAFVWYHKGFNFKPTDEWMRVDESFVVSSIIEVDFKYKQ